MIIENLIRENIKSLKPYSSAREEFKNSALFLNSSLADEYGFNDLMFSLMRFSIIMSLFLLFLCLQHSCVLVILQLMPLILLIFLYFEFLF